MGVRFYLQYVISAVDRDWNSKAKGVTNYRTLLGDIVGTVASEEDIAIVTFNYDRMLEWCLGDMLDRSFSTFDDYVSDRIKVFEIHGSVTWARKVTRPTLEALGDNPGGWNPCHYLIAHAEEVIPDGDWVVTQSRPIQVEDGTLAIPALAIPLTDTKESSLPESHRQALESLLPRVSRVLIIGWKAADSHFVKMLEKVVDASGVVVSPREPEATLERLKDCAGIRFSGERITFTGYSTGRGVRDLL
jgi:hypothetical protein